MTKVYFFIGFLATAVTIATVTDFPSFEIMSNISKTSLLLYDET